MTARKLNNTSPIDLFGYVPTDPARNQGFWTGVRAYLIAL